eukprot:7275066-Ditylum_brightwellii.AAC.1
MTNLLMPGDKCITRNQWAECLTQNCAMDIVLDKMDIWGKHIYSMKGTHGTGCARHGSHHIT